MKRTVFKITLFVLTGVQIIPAQAMWTSAARAALRSGQFNASTRLAPATIAGSNLLHSQPGTRLLARTLASTHDQDYRGYNRNGQHARSDSNSSESNGYDWKSFFARVDKAQIFGASILGWHLWWSESDICQTPEDFNDPKKLNLTKKFIQEFPPQSESYSPLKRDVCPYITTIAQMIRSDSRIAEELAPVMFNNFHNLSYVLTYDDYSFDLWDTAFEALIDTIKQYPKKTYLQKAVTDNFSVLATCTRGNKLILDIMKAQPAAVATIIQATIDNFVTLATHASGSKTIKQIMKLNPESAAAFSQLTADNFSTLAITWGGHRTILNIMKAQPTTAASFVQLTIDNFATLSTDRIGCQLIVEILQAQPNAIDTFETLGKKHAWKDFVDWIDKLRAKEAIKKLFEAPILTQTGQHFQALLKHNLNKIENFLPKSAKNIAAFKEMISNIVAAERREQELGNYTFVHAYPWNIRFLQDIDAQLRSIVYNTPPQPVSLRFIKPPKKTTGCKHQIVRKKILATGASKYYAYDNNKQKHMIFMNYALLTNQHGSNTLQYIANDRCENPPMLLLDKVFKHLDLERYHTKYQQEIVELEKLHREASMFGAGILFSFTPEMLEKSVYVCYGGGGKRKVVIDGIGKTDDVKLILDTLRTAPEKIKDLDRLEFVFVVTKDCALNPRVLEADAYKVIPFNAADPEKIALYEQKRDELMAKIKADIEAERTAKTPQELTAENEKIAAMMTWYATHSCLEGCKESRVQENV